jgi:hypothetical protein
MIRKNARMHKEMDASCMTILYKCVFKKCYIFLYLYFPKLASNINSEPGVGTVLLERATLTGTM